MEETKLPTVEIITTVSGWVVTFKAVIVTTEEQLEQVRLLRFAELIAFDTETSGLKVSLGARAIGYCLAAVTAENEITGYYIPVRHVNNDDTPQLSIEVVAPVVQEVLDGVSDDAFVALHHAKFDLAMARADGITIKRRIRDTMILATVANENETGFSLKRLASKYCCEGAETEEKALAAWMKKDARGLKLSYKKRSINKPDEPTYLERFGYARTPIDMCGFYGAKDVLYTLYLYAIHYRDVENQYPAVTEREHRVMRVLHEMEWTGLPADREEILRAHKACVADLKYWIDEATRLANIMLDEIDPLNELITEFELSPQFLGALFYQKFGLASPKQTDSGADSTDKEARQLLAHRYPEYAPLIKAIDKAARVEKLASTYTDAFLRHYSEETGRIHPSYNQVERRDEGGVPVTGRLSSGDPNIQNCAKKPAHLHDCRCLYCIAESLGKKASELDESELLLIGASNTISVRRYFTVPKGFIRLLVDFSQIELRVLAWFSRDARLLECYANDLDVHAITATEVTSGDRDIAKQVNFGNCLLEGALIKTARGEIPIERVVKGDLVLTHRGRYRLVSATKKTERRDLVFLRTNTGKSLAATPEHYLLCTFPTGGACIAGRGWVEAQDFLVGQYLTYHGIDHAAGETKRPVAYARALGWYLAEGHYCENTGLRITQDFAANPRVAARMDAELTLLGFRKWMETVTLARFCLPRADALALFSNDVDLYLLSAAKCLPRSVMSWCREAQLALLAGLWDGDGSVYLTKHRRLHIHYHSISLPLLRGVQALLDLFGINSVVRDYKKPILTIIGSEGRARFMSLVETEKRVGVSPRKEFATTEKIVSAQRACFADAVSVYDLSVEEDHSFVANGLISHNSYGMTEIGLAKRIADYYRDPEGTRKLAKQILINYFRTYCGIPRFRQEFARDMRANGNMFVNPFGRPRRLPDIGAWEQWRRERAERMMMSSIISGTAADIMKESMLRCDAVLQETSPESKIVQSIHDELVFDLRAQPGWANVAVAIVREMEDWPLFSDRGVPIRVACKLTTTDWEHLRELKVLPDGRLQLEN